MPQGRHLSEQVADAFELLSWSIQRRKNLAFDQHPSLAFTDLQQELELDEQQVQEIISATRKLLDGAYTLLEPVGFGFGYRVINEVCTYLCCWLKARQIMSRTETGILTDGWRDALDKVFLQKVLPKIHGNRRQLGDSLSALSAFLKGNDLNGDPPAKYRLGTSETVVIRNEQRLELGDQNPMWRSLQKLNRMQNQLQSTGYVTFIQ